MTDIVVRLNASLSVGYSELRKEAAATITRLRAKIKQMERQEPVWFIDERGEPKRYDKSKADYCKYGGLDLLYALPGAKAQSAPSFADAYQGAMEEVAIWKKRTLEAEELNRKFVAEINGPVYMGEPAQPAPSVPDGWKLVPIEPTQEMINHVIDERFEALVAGKDHTFIDIYKAMLAAAPEVKPTPSVPDDWLQHAARMATLARKLREPDWHFESIREMQRELCALEDAALAAAPEAKP